MPTTRLRSRNTAGPEPEKARDSGIDSALTGHPPSGGNGNTTTNHTDRKRSVGEALSDSEGDAPTKKSQKSALKGRDARQRRKHEAPAASVTPPKGPRKRTNEHPGLIGKKPRRTKAEVAAEKAAKEAKTKELEEANAEAVDHLAAMEVDQKRAEAEQHCRILRRQPSVPIVTADDSDHSEVFDLGSPGESEEMEVDSDTTPSDNPVPVAAKRTKALKAKLPPRPKREKLTQAAKQSKEDNSRRDGKKRNVAASSPLASGLKDSWKQKAKSNGGLVQDTAILGGLDDDHASGIRPKSKKRKAGRVSFVDEVIGEVSGDSETDILPPVQAKSSNTKKGKSAGHAAQATQESALAVENARAMSTNPKTATKGSKLKAVIVPKAANPVNMEKAEAIQPLSALAAQISCAKKFTDLPPSFRNSKLIEKFRATCYHEWMTSSDPFDSFTLDSSHLLQVVRDAFKETFPDTEYVPVTKDIFHQTIYNNLQVHRSTIASQAMKDVTYFLSSQSKEDIKEWAEWTRAARLGELVYLEPCPRGCSLDRKAPNFKKPRGLFMTTFVKRLAEPYLEYMNRSLIDYGHPYGLMALILVALERALRAFENSGEYEHPGPFNSSYKALFTEYLGSANDFTKWADFYAACKFAQNDLRDGGVAADVSQIDIGRRALNFSSSPIGE